MGQLSLKDFLVSKTAPGYKETDDQPSQSDIVPVVASLGDHEAQGLMDGSKHEPRSSSDHEPSTSQMTMTSDPIRHLARSVVDRSVHGRLCPWSVGALNHQRMKMYRPVLNARFLTRRILATGSSYRPQHQMIHRGTYQSVDVDNVGELFVSGDDAGVVRVSRVDALLGSHDDDRSGHRAVDVETDLGIGLQTKIASVKWNPSNENEIAVLQNKGRQMLVYDINRTQGEPSRVVRLLTSGGEDMKYFDAQSTQGQEYCTAIGCSDGSVALCDARVQSQPVCMLRSMTRDAITCLDIIDHGRLVLGGTVRDDIKVWDLRKVSGNALNFGAVPNKHPLLHTVHLIHELSQVPGLVDESGYIPLCTPQSLHSDPESYHRVAVHMSSGWTSVLDMTRLGMTHLHAPPVVHMQQEAYSMTLDDAVNARVIGDSGRVALPHEIMQMENEAIERRVTERRGKRSGCWLHGSQFVAPSRSKDALFIIDFGASSHAGTRIGFSHDEGLRTPSAVEIDVPLMPTCVVSIAGGKGESLLAFGTQGQCTILQ